MKHIKLFENFQQSEYYIRETCKKYIIKNYTINSDWSIDVDGDVNLSMCKLKEIPLNFNIINGDFNCGINNITSLKGAPKKVNGNFRIFRNELTNLEYSPKIVTRNFDCSSNKLTSLNGSPESIGGEMNIALNDNLSSLEGSPKTVGSLHSTGNHITSLEGSPTNVNGNFRIDSNQIHTLIGFECYIDGIFIVNKKLSLIYEILKEHLEYVNNFYNFNILSDIENNQPTLNLKRFKKFIDLYGIEEPNEEFYRKINGAFIVV